ncbi:MAG: hypothetical protein KBA46_06050 [Candidatus Omnitrophica bacterium]|nr:hypothetical protein [Candidatus Omnitrophota bacterium]
MKKIFVLAIIGILATMTLTSAYAATTSGAIAVTASIQAGTPDMTVRVYRAPNGDPDLINFNAPVTTMTFDKFDLISRPTKASQWTTVDQFVAFVYATGLGKQYKITSKTTGAGQFTRTGGAETLPINSFACTPVYAAEDVWKLPDGTEVAQGARPAGSTLGTVGPAINAAGKLVYQSENPGSARIIQIWYGFPPYTATGANPYTGYAPIPSTQTAGSYTGVNVVIDITPV